MAYAGPIFPNFDIHFEDNDSDEELAAFCDEYDTSLPQSLVPVEETTSANTNRFATIDQNQQNEIVDNAQAKGTKKATKWAVNVFQGKHKHQSLKR